VVDDHTFSVLHSLIKYFLFDWTLVNLVSLFFLFDIIGQGWGNIKKNMLPMPWYISNRCHNSVQLNRRTIQKHKIKRISTAEMKTENIRIEKMNTPVRKQLNKTWRPAIANQDITNVYLPIEFEATKRLHLARFAKWIHETMNLYLLFLPIYANNLFVLMIIFLYITFMKENKNIKSRKLYLITSFFVFTLIFGL
jgi:hypothetical protein